MTNEVKVKTVQRTKRVMDGLQGALNGSGEDKYGIGKAIADVIGYTLLSNVAGAFVVKARGGTDEMGIKWKPLSPITISKRRVGKEDMKDPAIKTRVETKKRIKKYYKSRYLLTMPEPQAEIMAERVSEQMTTKDTGATRLEVLGRRNVEILRDTGRLLNSLQPGELYETATTIKHKPAKTDVPEDQKFESVPGTVTIGTNVEYAGEHQNGVANRKPLPPLPRRQFLPVDKIPNVWRQDMTDAVRQAFEVILAKIIS